MAIFPPNRNGLKDHLQPCLEIPETGSPLSLLYCRTGESTNRTFESKATNNLKYIYIYIYLTHTNSVAFPSQGEIRDWVWREGHIGALVFWGHPSSTRSGTPSSLSPPRWAQRGCCGTERAQPKAKQKHYRIHLINSAPWRQAKRGEIHYRSKVWGNLEMSLFLKERHSFFQWR